MDKSAPHILVVEDDIVTRMKLAHYFCAEGYRVSQAANGSEMRQILQNDPATVLMIDVNLPGDDGLKLAREQREHSDAGIIIITSRTSTTDRIVGLEVGADDYVTKPFEPRELLARVKNLIWRLDRGRSMQSTAQTIRFAGWRLDLGKRTLQGEDGRFVDITRSEFKLLALLASKPGQVMSRSRILKEIANREWDVEDRTVDVLVRRLRRKFGDQADHPQIIGTSHGEGYYLAAIVE
ncbi:two-component system response regulator TorR [Hyphomicrobium sp. ghe19]|uniref:two-component system response regulator TorR n=1 Tax=Hyphomicrobium sp. ghe19 TaxID=2682968 RepID=UPI0013669FEE|nr:Aerobic respiration control protein ArcA [Hyphomicrobium sp. ghe19]